MLSNLNLWSYLYEDKLDNKDIDVKPDDVKSEPIRESNKDDVSSTEKAKEWGSYILGVGKTATNIAAKQVSSTAKQIRQNVSEIGLIEQSNIISKFSNEQTKFMEEKKQFEKKKRENCLPWINALSQGDEEEQILKSKVLSISSDEWNFIRNPPPGSGFEFNYDLHAPVAEILLKEDIVLGKMRYKLVPKRITEETFWRNYFYRVFLIKQSLQPDKEVNNNEITDVKDDPVDNIGSRTEISNEDLEKVKSITSKIDSGKENEEWEAELQKELSEFELVNEVSGPDIVTGDDKGDYDDLEREILSELEK